MRSFLRTLFTSRYTRFLEDEREWLLSELRLWQDAALVREGLPKLTPKKEADVKPPQMKPRWLPSQWRNAIERNAEKRFSERVEREKKEAAREKIGA